MLEELAGGTGAAAFVIGSMVFFFAVWVVIVVRVWRAKREDMDAHARLPLEGEEDGDAQG